MANYEIMMIVDPKEDFKVVENIVNDVFKAKGKVEKLDKTELAYEIKKSKTAHYALINIEATGEEVKELTRRVNISKTFWRLLAINLDREVGREEALVKIKARKEKLAEEFEQRKAYREAKAKEYEARKKSEKSEKEN